jgi:hypothetical protein
MRKFVIYLNIITELNLLFGWHQIAAQTQSSFMPPDHNEQHKWQQQQNQLIIALAVLSAALATVKVQLGG